MEEYLELEAESPVKHDYVAGEIFALAGATDLHNQLALNLVVALWASARVKGFVFASDVKVRMPGDVFYYPDVMLVCEEDADPLVKTKPCFIAEVLSESTESVDRREKLLAYQGLQSVTDYLIVSQRDVACERFTRDEQGWTRATFGAGETIELVSLGLSLDMAEIYEEIELDASG